MTTIEIVSAALVGLGAFVALTGGVGVIRMPDFYTRCHCAGKGDTLAQFLIMAGLVTLASESWLETFAVADLLPIAKLVFITMFILVTSPTATHAVARAARLDGLEPWKPGEPRR